MAVQIIKYTLLNRLAIFVFSNPSPIIQVI